MKKLSENGTERYVFIYDESGAPYAIEYYNGYSGSMSKYYYILNVQGDVIQIVDSENNVVANYTYDAWGKLLSVTSSSGTVITSSTHIANVNPLRYRSYFYDVETGFYYCNSRYYDPQMRRFINADAYVSTGQGFGGFNMFTYCQNNPVMFADPNGYKYVSIREYVESNGGTVYWNDYTKKAYFYLNGQSLVINVDCSNDPGIAVSNYQCRFRAQDYEIAYYFNVSGWSTLMPGFKWNDKNDHSKGFMVDTTGYFLSKSFCKDFAKDIMKTAKAGWFYCGKTSQGVATECYAHAVLLVYTSMAIALFERGYKFRGSAKEIGFEWWDWHTPMYDSIWINADALNPLHDYVFFD